MRKQGLLWAGILLGVALLLLAGAIAFDLLNVGGVQAQTPTRTPAATAGEVAGPPRTITVVGEGSVNITPDIVRTIVGVETMGDTVQEATAEASDTISNIVAALVEMGVAERDIQTANFSVWTERVPGPDGMPTDEVIYRVTNQLNVTIRDLDNIGSVLDAAIEAGANNIFGINFDLEDPESVASEAREEAVANALAKAQELAALNGVDVGSVVSISEIVEGGPVPFFGGLMQGGAAEGLGGGAGPFSPGELEMTLRLQITYAIE